jgi:hypothetical protein
MKINSARGAIAAAGAAIVLALSGPVAGGQQSTDSKKAQEKTGSTAAMKISLTQLEQNPQQYMGKPITVSGEVQEVVGPRLFTIDETNWIDFDMETLVAIPAPLAAMVRENDTITITGTLRPFVKVELQREWGWFDPDPRLEAEFSRRGVLMANTVVGTEDRRDLIVRMEFDQRPQPVGTAGKAQSAMTDLNRLAADEGKGAVGENVELKNARIAKVEPSGGFWVHGAGDERLFILPVDRSKPAVREGQTVSISGTVLELPNGIRNRLSDRTMARQEDVYVFASRVAAG